MTTVPNFVSDFVIETANDESGGGIATLIASVFSEYEGCPFVEDEFGELKDVSAHYQALGGEIWVATRKSESQRDGPVIGCLAIFPNVTPGIFELSKMYVSRKARGTGLAQKLYSEAVNWGTANRLEVLRLWTDTRFASGHRFYEKLGFAKQPVVRYLGDAGQSWEYLYICTSPTAP